MYYVECTRRLATAAHIISGPLASAYTALAGLQILVRTPKVMTGSW